METLFVTYAVAWAAVGAYAVSLSLGNGRLARRLERLESLAAPEPNNVTPHTRVA